MRIKNIPFREDIESNENDNVTNQGHYVQGHFLNRCANRRKGIKFASKPLENQTQKRGGEQQRENNNQKKKIKSKQDVQEEHQSQQTERAC